MALVTERLDEVPPNISLALSRSRALSLSPSLSLSLSLSTRLPPPVRGPIRQPHSTAPALVSHTKSFQGRFTKVHSHTNPSTCF